MKLRKEYQEVVDDNASDDRTIAASVFHAVAACQAIADRPRKQLSDEEIVALHKRTFPIAGPDFQKILSIHRAVIAAYDALQLEPEKVTVKVYVYRDNDFGNIVVRDSSFPASPPKYILLDEFEREVNLEGR